MDDAQIEARMGVLSLILDSLRVNPAARRWTLERLLRGVTVTPEEAAFLAAVVVGASAHTSPAPDPARREGEGRAPNAAPPTAVDAAPAPRAAPGSADPRGALGHRCTWECPS